MKTMIVIREATKAQASDIAQLIMMAMTAFLWSRAWLRGLPKDDDLIGRARGFAV